MTLKSQTRSSSPKKINTIWNSIFSIIKPFTIMLSKPKSGPTFNNELSCPTFNNELSPHLNQNLAINVNTINDFFVAHSIFSKSIYMKILKYQDLRFVCIRSSFFLHPLPRIQYMRWHLAFPLIFRYVIFLRFFEKSLLLCLHLELPHPISFCLMIHPNRLWSLKRSLITLI